MANCCLARGWCQLSGHEDQILTTHRPGSSICLCSICTIGLHSQSWTFICEFFREVRFVWLFILFFLPRASLDLLYLVLIYFLEGFYQVLSSLGYCWDSDLEEAFSRVCLALSSSSFHNYSPYNFTTAPPQS